MAVDTQLAARSSTKRHVLAETLAYLPGSASRILMLFGLLATGAILPVAASAGLKETLDALPTRDQAMFIRGLVLLVVSFSAAAIISALSTKVRATVLETIAVNQRRRIAETALSLPLLESDRLERGDVVSRLTADVTESAKLVTNLYQTADIILKAISAAAYMLFLNREVGFVVVACSVAVVGAARLANRGIPAAAKGYQSALGALSASALNILEGRIVIKAFLAGDRMVQVFDRHAAGAATAGRRLAGRIAAATLWSVILAYLPTVAAFGFSGYMVAAGRMSFGSILALLHLCDYFGPLSLLGDRFAQTQRSVGALERVQEFTARLQPIVGDAPEAAAPPSDVALQADHVWFGYGDQQPVLKDVSLTVEIGARIAVMGCSGSGKSSLLKVLAGLYPPTHGSVSRAAQVTYQPQEPFIFPGSIRDNLLIADQDASLDQLLAALGTADAAEFVTGLAAGFETEAGERGGRLSGGQRQRLALARTILKRSSILLLDEPTGSLDRDSEARVLASLSELPDATLVMVTHRFKTAEACDRVIVVDNGTIVESGTHAELLAHGGLYRALFTGGDAESPDAQHQARGLRGETA